MTNHKEEFEKNKSDIEASLDELTPIVKKLISQNAKATAAALMVLTRESYLQSHDIPTAAMMFYSVADNLASLPHALSQLKKK